MTELTQSRLKELLHYDADTGVFTWIAPPKSMPFLVNTPAGTPHPKGYIVTRIDKKPYLNHRLAWFYFHGVIPVEIDHRNRIKNDNRIKNLRVATSQENIQNRAKRKNCSSKFVGVNWSPEKSKWRAQFHDKSGKQSTIGFFEIEIDAAKIAEKKRREIQGEYFNEFTSVLKILESK